MSSGGRPDQGQRQSRAIQYRYCLCGAARSQTAWNAAAHSLTRAGSSRGTAAAGVPSPRSSSPGPRCRRRARSHLTCRCGPIWRCTVGTGTALLLLLMPTRSLPCHLPSADSRNPGISDHLRPFQRRVSTLPSAYPTAQARCRARCRTPIAGRRPGLSCVSAGSPRTIRRSVMSPVAVAASWFDPGGRVRQYSLLAFCMLHIANPE